MIIVSFRDAMLNSAFKYYNLNNIFLKDLIEPLKYPLYSVAQFLQMESSTTHQNSGCVELTPDVKNLLKSAF